MKKFMPCVSGQHSDSPGSDDSHETPEEKSPSQNPAADQSPSSPPPSNRSPDEAGPSNEPSQRSPSRAAASGPSVRPKTRHRSSNPLRTSIVNFVNRFKTSPTSSGQAASSPEGEDSVRGSPERASGNRSVPTSPVSGNLPHQRKHSSSVSIPYRARLIETVGRARKSTISESSPSSPGAYKNVSGGLSPDEFEKSPDAYVKCPQYNYNESPRGQAQRAMIDLRTFPEAEFEESPLIVPLFFESGRCDQVMPLSGKVVILGNNLKVDKAFFCLVENAMRAAPVWDSSKMEFIGMLTITDFIDVLLYYNSRQEEIVDFANQTISDWRNITGKIDKFICIDPNASLIEAVRLLVQEKVHRLPIFDEKTQSVLYTLTYKRILRHFLVWGLGTDRQIASIFPKPRFFSRSIRELQLGTFENIAVAHYDMTVIEALEIFQARRVSSLPVVENNLLVDVYAKFDVFALAKDNAYNNLNITIRQALRERNEYQEPLLTCTLDDTLQCILDRIVESGVHRVIIVKPKRIFVGIISLSDIIKFLALRNEADNGAAVEGAVGGAAEAIPLNDESHEILQQVDKPFGSGDSASASSGLKPPSDAQLSSQQALQAEIESIPFVESADEDEVFNKPLDASSNDPVTEGSSSEEEKTVEALEKLVIS